MEEGGGRGAAWSGLDGHRVHTVCGQADCVCVWVGEWVIYCVIGPRCCRVLLVRLRETVGFHTSRIIHQEAAVCATASQEIPQSVYTEELLPGLESLPGNFLIPQERLQTKHLDMHK